MVLQGDFIPPLRTLSQLARLCLNITFSLRGLNWNTPHLVLLLKMHKESWVINVNIIIF